MAALHFLSKTIKLFFSFWMNSNSFSVLNSTFTVIYFVCLNFLFFFYRFSFWNREKHKIKPNICESFNSQGHYISFSSAITIIYLDYQDIAWWGEQKYCTLKQTYPEWKRQHLRDPLQFCLFLFSFFNYCYWISVTFQHFMLTFYLLIVFSWYN